MYRRDVELLIDDGVAHHGVRVQKRFIVGLSMTSRPRRLFRFSPDVQFVSSQGVAIYQGFSLDGLKRSADETRFASFAPALRDAIHAGAILWTSCRTQVGMIDVKSTIVTTLMDPPALRQILAELGVEIEACDIRVMRVGLRTFGYVTSRGYFPTTVSPPDEEDASLPIGTHVGEEEEERMSDMSAFEGDIDALRRTVGDRTSLGRFLKRLAMKTRTLPSSKYIVGTSGMLPGRSMAV